MVSRNYKMGIFLWITVAVCLKAKKSFWVKANFEDYRDHDYGPLSLLSREHFQYHIRSRELSASELMVDLTNELSYRLMYYHSIFNRNNFAFSPTALMSILIALYEGSEGHSAHQLKHILQLPNHKDIVRIGNRDIHRRLRTYFFGSENPLKGLSLNKENVTILPHYESILAFYGYDLSADMISQVTLNTLVPINNDLDFQSPNISGSGNRSEFTTTVEPPVNTTLIGNNSASGIDDVEVLNFTRSSGNGSSDASDIGTTLPLIATTTSLQIDKSTTVIKTSTATTTTTAATTTTTTSTTTTAPPPTDPPLVSGESLADLGAELISSLINAANSETFARIQKNQSNNKPPSAKLQAPLIPMTPRINYLPAQKKSPPYFAGKRHRRHSPIDQKDQWFLNWYNANLGKLSSHSYPFKSDINEEIAFMEPWSFNKPDPSSLHSNHEQLHPNYNTDVISHVFYLSNKRTIYTTFKVYNAVLYHKYFEQWHMSVIELELDTAEYNLIILLPDFNADLLSSAASLNFPTVPKLRAVRKQLKPKWVQAIIPDFRLHGVTFLTNDLQNMGITDIFEPNRADFRSMTDEKGTYIKHIQQSIKIHIRTHPINQIKGNNGPQVHPIQISVNHPFIFFIVDRDLDVAVMTGRILNPLNVRIQ